jgi:hypothetical protein
MPVNTMPTQRQEGIVRRGFEEAVPFGGYPVEYASVRVNAYHRRLVSDERQLIQFRLNRLSDFDPADAQDPVPDREKVGMVPDRDHFRPAHGEAGAGAGTRLLEVPVLNVPDRVDAMTRAVEDDVVPDRTMCVQPKAKPVQGRE